MSFLMVWLDVGNVSAFRKVSFMHLQFTHTMGTKVVLAMGLDMETMSLTRLLAHSSTNVGKWKQTTKIIFPPFVNSFYIFDKHTSSTRYVCACFHNEEFLKTHSELSEFCTWNYRAEVQTMVRNGTTMGHRIFPPVGRVQVWYFKQCPYIIECMKTFKTFPILFQTFIKNRKVAK